MKITMAVVSDLRTDARVQREARALAGAGHDVEVIGFDYSVSSKTRRREGAVSYVLFPFPSRNVSKVRRRLGALLFLFRASFEILRTDAAALHSHNLHLAVPVMIAARRRRIPFVYDAHELVREMQRGRRRDLATWFERFVWNRAAAVITTNESRADYLAKLHSREKPVSVGNYPETPRSLEPLDLHATFDIPVESRILIYQGGLYTEARNFAEIAQALVPLPHWSWVLIGFGSDESRADIERLVADAGIADRCRMVPAVPLAELLQYTAGADAGIVPLLPIDLNNILGDTNKMFEYLMAGIPAVGSDFPELRRVILDNPVGPVGAVFDPTDPDSITAAIREVESSLPQLRDRATIVGHEWYSWERESSKLVEVYERIALAATPLSASAPAAAPQAPLSTHDRSTTT